MILSNIKNYLPSNNVSKWHIKALIALLAFSIVISLILFTQSLVHELILREQKIINLYANIYKYYSESWSGEGESSNNFEDYFFFLDEITPTISFPFIMTDENDKPLEPFETWSLNIDIDTSLSIQQRRVYMQDYVNKMKDEYQPIIYIKEEQGGKVLTKFYYTHSALIDKLQYFPLVSIVIIAIFIIISYTAFSNIRKNEESKVWVGMAKEAAHQLGTPLSSILAWIEILKYGKDNPVSIEETIKEMENDVSRLNTIATRFSKIGSLPDKEAINIVELIENVCGYFERRLPHLGRRVKIIRDLKDQVIINVNIDLFAWVIENLIKNAAEAFDDSHGEIYIYTKVHTGKKIYIYIRDTGKGMTPKLRRQIFYPGFTTKKRGWGLGLSLCKRIIEEYHSGKIYVKETAVGKGTTFAIELPLKS